MRGLGARPAHREFPLAKCDRPGKSGLCKSPHDRNFESRSEVSSVRGPPVRMSPVKSRFEIKWNGETDIRAAWCCFCCVAAVKGEDMRTGGPRTQPAHQGILTHKIRSPCLCPLSLQRLFSNPLCEPEFYWYIRKLDRPDSMSSDRGSDGRERAVKDGLHGSKITGRLTPRNGEKHRPSRPDLFTFF